MICTLALAIAMTTTIHATPTLPPCPGSPNCVSSQADDSHRIEPIKISGVAKSEFGSLRQLLSQRTDTTIVSADDAAIKVEFRTTLGFVDDAMFALDLANAVIHVRSAARLGYWDLGKNRRRMEEIRRSYLEERH